jgi:hypothetical protein
MVPEGQEVPQGQKKWRVMRFLQTLQKVHPCYTYMCTSLVAVMVMSSNLNVPVYDIDYAVGRWPLAKNSQRYE